MYVIVIGGGKVGYYLSKHLLDRGYEVTLIEKDPRRAEVLNSALGEIVMVGDGDEMAFLATTGMERADVVVAVEISGPVEDHRREVPNALECLYATVLVMTHSIVSEKLRHGAPDLLVQPKVGSFRALGFLQASAILRAADHVKAELKEKLGRLLV